MNTNEIRQKFLDYFKKNSHTVVSSDSLVPSADPSLLFTSAGMVQFKKHFLGQIDLEFRRAASVQKCLRTSDIERVGETARHLTFFEMLGNFSFGDYFKTEAITWAWEFLTQELGLPKEKLYPSVYEKDDEAFDLWLKFVPRERIVRLGEDSNFWTMGPTGPCGPCSEILFDRGEQFGCGAKCIGPGCDCDRYLEVWNLVFTQYDRAEDGTLNPLPQKNIDTGMGLERLSMVVNGVKSSYEIDLFQNLMKNIAQVIGSDDEKALRRIADHLRSCTFLISDGILPSNEGRGYVLRRLLRRALRAGWKQGRKTPFLHELVGVVVSDMGNAYPQLKARQESIESIILTEEKNSLETIGSGTRALQQAVEEICQIDAIEKLPSGKNISIDGEKVFYIYDTYGLDKDIQREIVKDWGGNLEFKEEDYLSAKAKAVETARKGWKGSGQRDNTIYSELQKKTGKIAFCGYETLSTEATVVALLKDDDGKLVLVQELSLGEQGEVVLNQTPFYAESGGQVGDQGTISGNGFELEVLDTQKPVDGLIVSQVRVKKGSVKPGFAVNATVNKILRQDIMRHHTATHLLHAALRKNLGTQVTQAGSLVSSEKLRFDFTYPKALTADQLGQIESEVNAAILQNIKRHRSEETMEQAQKMGALAFFGEKYGSKVFVVKYDETSTELCGGTHCSATGEIGAFKILSETSAASGVRRIEALAGQKALSFFSHQQKILVRAADQLKASPEQLTEKIEKLLRAQNDLEAELTKLKQKQAMASLGSATQQTLTIKNGDKTCALLALVVDASDSGSLRTMSDNLRAQLGSGLILLAAQLDDKLSFVVSSSQDSIADGFSAGDLAKQFAKKINGRGGGKDSFAQGGGAATPDLKNLLSDFVTSLVK